MFTLDRRQFLKLAGAGAATAAAGPGLMRLAFAQGGGAQQSAPLIVVFLRGGSDGLSLVPPTGGSDRHYYELARPETQIPLSGPDAALALKNTGGLWGLHPRATGLQQLYNANKLAVVLGTGMPAPVTRSHFNAQITMELGTPGSTGIGSGWLSRHLTSAGLAPELVIPAVSAGSLTATSLIASNAAVTMGSGDAFRINSAPWSWESADHYSPPPAGFEGLVETLPALWSGQSRLDRAGRDTLDALATVRPMDFENYVPGNGAVYPGSNFSDQLQMLAQLIKAGVGLTTATIDAGNWDTHNGQAYQFGEMTERLSQGLAAFQQDLDGSPPASPAASTTTVVMTEFGRRVRENASRGTDHGYGSVMLALGNPVNGGLTYGINQYAGLADAQRFAGEDVDVTIDYRQVLSEALIKRQYNNHLGFVFPGYHDYAPLGIFQGAAMPPDYSRHGWDTLFANGFD